MILVNVGQGWLDPTVRVPSAPLSGLNSYDLRFHVSFISGKSRYLSTWVRDDSILRFESHPHHSQVSIHMIYAIMYLSSLVNHDTRQRGSEMTLQAPSAPLSSVFMWFTLFHSALHLALLGALIPFLGVLLPGLSLWAFDCHLGPQSCSQAASAASWYAAG